METRPPNDVAVYFSCLSLTALFCTGAFTLKQYLQKCGRIQGTLTACKSNCKNLATALEMWASDHGGHYPPSLDLLVLTPNYLKAIPTCPASGADTYSVTYRASRRPDSFFFCCLGNNHAKAYTGFSGPSNNYPRYTAELGLIDHP